LVFVNYVDMPFLHSLTPHMVKCATKTEIQLIKIKSQPHTHPHPKENIFRKKLKLSHQFLKEQFPLALIGGKKKLQEWYPKWRPLVHITHNLCWTVPRLHNTKFPQNVCQ